MKDKMDHSLSGVGANPDPSTGSPVPTIEMTEDEAFEWIRFMCTKARELNTVYSFPIMLGVGLAKCLMALNEVDEHDKNRKLKPTKVDRYASEIVAGRWELTSEPIIVALTGYMNDGQHRCEAVIATGIAIPTTISFGVTRESRMKVDLGGIRTGADHLDMLGEKFSHFASVAAKYLAQHEAGMVIGPTNKNPKGKDGKAIRSGHFLSTNAGTEYYQEKRDEIQSAITAIKPSRIIKSHKVLTPSLTTTIMVLLRRANEANALVFMEQLLDGIGYTENNDPIYVARKRLENGQSLSHHGKVELILRSWNAWRRNRTVKKFDLTGDLPEIVR